MYTELWKCTQSYGNVHRAMEMYTELTQVIIYTKELLLLLHQILANNESIVEMYTELTQVFLVKIRDKYHKDKKLKS